MTGVLAMGTDGASELLQSVRQERQDGGIMPLTKYNKNDMISRVVPYFTRPGSVFLLWGTALT